MSETTKLYAASVAGPYTALCGGGDNSSGSMEDCLTIAELAGGGYSVKDTKLGDDSPELRFSRGELLRAAAELPGLL